MAILDLGLPGIDGQTLVTTYGCNAYVSKPLDVRAFVNAVNHFCQERPAL